METGGSPTVTLKKTNLTPKAIVHQKFGSKACYIVEKVQEMTQNECPGLAIIQKGPPLFRCTLQLPDFSVMSEICKKKRDAEQSAAEKALDKIGFNLETNNLTNVQDPWDNMISRLSYLFSDELLSTLHPLSGHFRAVLQREGDLSGSIPVCVMAIYDAKLCSLCKSIDPMVETNPLLAVQLVMKAAARLPGFIVSSEEHLWMRRENPFPSEILQSLITEEAILPESVQIKAVRIPYSPDKIVEPMSINVSSNGYYMDAIAQELAVKDVFRVLISRSIGKASSEMRLYSSVDLSSDVKENVKSEEYFNVRASYFSGQDIHGDAILACIGYTWKSRELYHEDVSVRTYYRMLINKMPSGVYKLSREAILAADLPVAFTTRTNWRGSSPRDLLCTFCRQHHLSEPVFSPINNPLKSLVDSLGSGKRLKVEEPGKEGTEYANGNGVAATGREPVAPGSTFNCEVKIYSKCQNLIVHCLPKNSYKKQADAFQSTALKLLSWLNTFFKEPDMPLEKLTSSGYALNIRFNPQFFFKEFALCPSVHNVWQRTVTEEIRSLDSDRFNHPCIEQGVGVSLLNIEGQDSGVSPSSGSLVCINYNISLVTKGENTKELLESNDDFEFEIGTGAVIPQLEAGVIQLSLGQFACFHTELHPEEFILAAAGDSAKTLSLLSSKACCLEFSIILLKVTEPLEDRMEQAFFNPPLSKQRVEYALRHIKESSATTLIDFGCGSGSLLGSLLDYPTALEKIVGVDISQKSLIRAAKILHSKLSSDSDAELPNTRIRSALLYEGSITDVDSRLYGFDIGTCLEVIEHMEEDQACLFGDVVLSYFCPRILIVSTPNYEYNVILQRSNPASQEDPNEKTQSQSCKFRNHDHKFEWTRQQFNRWAADLAARHNYSVEYSGVGGFADLEPGFASQIAVFCRGDNHSEGQGDDDLKKIDTAHKYEIVWEWDRSRTLSSAV